MTTIRSKTIIFFAFMLFVVFVATERRFSFSKNISLYAKSLQTIEEFQVRFMQLHVYEKDFKYNYLRDTLFFLKSETFYSNKHQELMKTVNVQLSDFGRIKQMKNLKINLYVDTILDKTDRYRRVFADYVLAHQMIGNQKNGLLGKVQTNFEKVNQLTDNELIKSNISRLISLENKFLLKNDSSYLRQHKILYTNLLKNIRKKKTGVLDMEIIFLLEKAETNFNAVVEQTNTIGTGYKNGYRQQLDELNKACLSQLKAMHHLVLKRFNWLKNLDILVLLLSSALILLSLAFFLNFLIKRFLTAFKLMETKINLLTTNSLVKPINTVAEKEIQQLYKKLNKLIFRQKEDAEFAKAIAQAEFNTAYRFTNEENLLGNSLLKIRQELKEVKQADEERKGKEDKQSWITSGEVVFSEILRDVTDLKQLSENILTKLIHYLNATQGGIFIFDGNETLNLMASYAYDRKKKQEKEIRLGEGLIGMSALDKHTLFLDKIPDGYLEITSGLGNAHPEYLIIVPLVYHNELFGVFELASFEKYADFQLEFLEKIATNIAATISLIQIGLKTNRLLKQEHRQTEKLSRDEDHKRLEISELRNIQKKYVAKNFEQQKMLATYRRAFEHLHQAVIFIDKRAMIIDANLKAENLSLYKSKMLKNRSLDLIFPNINLDKITFGKIVNVNLLRKNGKAVACKLYVQAVSDRQLAVFFTEK